MNGTMTDFPSEFESRSLSVFFLLMSLFHRKMRFTIFEFRTANFG